MTRTRTTKSADAAFAQGRLRLARAYLQAARAEVALAAEGNVGNAAMSQIVNAAIAFTDALTARYAARTNQGDHAAAARTLRDAVGNRLSAAQETRLRRILGQKDEVQYGARAKTAAEARRLLEQLETFPAWAEAEMQRPS